MKDPASFWGGIFLLGNGVNNYVSFPIYAADIRKEQFVLNLSYKPTDAIFRGEEVSVRIDEPSFSKKLQTYGYEGISEEIECMIFTTGVRPESREDTLTIGGIGYDISEVSDDPGSGCYNLTLRKRRAVK
ncbi:hypothetical protein [Puniceicoccus vermicola]|uniref:Uncharacterized protein n=1 Tax=Puniceicoccus vermicola TaxID=388746 RepID=A0A7X1AY03_9BACT|nr:hypothetical protein [Puniceicoccus vermicola]MBC2602080.1 hypothetical protein [Puniceicoccus vermicola]